MIAKIKEFLHQTLLLVAGSALCAFSVKVFLMQHELLSHGTTGLALLIFYRLPQLGLPMSVIYLLINIPVFVLGWRFVGRRFIFYSMWGMFIYSAALYLTTLELDVGESKMLATLVAGALSGTGVALILRSYGCGGGSDILCVILNKFFSITLGTAAMLINVIILGALALSFPIEKVLYTLIYVFISAYFTDKVFHGFTRRRTAMIISDQWKAITEALNAHRIGVTLLHGQGGFRGDKRTLMYSVLASQSIPVLKRVAKEIDENVFIAIMQADDVTGVEVGNQPHW